MEGELVLGMVAQEQQQREQAEHYYHQSLQIFTSYDDHYAQARTYHNLGIVAQWEQAEHYYQQALQIFTSYDDRYAQADTYNNLYSFRQRMIC